MFTIEESLVRTAREDDAAAVAAVFAGYVTGSVVTFETSPPTVASWQARIRAEPPFVVLAQDAAVLGFAFASPWRGKPAYKHTVETSVFVAPEHTGRGYGKRLLAELVSRCDTAGYRQAIAVIVDTGDGASIGLHQAAGFEPAGRLRAVGYKHGRWLDTLLMQLAL